MIDWFSELYRIIKQISYGGVSKKLTAQLISALDETLTPGSSPGGGSFLSANTARVDASGNDATGTSGDLTKPFLTVQAAIDAIALALTSSDYAIIDIGVNEFTETLTIDNTADNFPVLIFKGVTNNGNQNDNSIAFSSLTITADGNQVDIRLKDCGCGSINTDSPLVVLLDNANFQGQAVISTADQYTLTIGSVYGTGALPGTITADDSDILVFGMTADAPGGSSISSANGAITIANCGQAPEGTTFGSYTPSVFSVSSGHTVLLNDSIVKDLTCKTAHLVRSKVLGTLTATDPTQPVTDDQGPYAYNYDFGRDGGASGTITLTPSSGSNGNSLPTNFIVTRAILEIITPLDSAAHLAHVAMTTGESAGDLVAVALVSSPPWSTTGLKSLSVLIKTTGPDAPAIVITTEDLTAGKFTLHIDGYQSL